MQKTHLKLEGEEYLQKISLFFGDEVLYDGFVDNLVTSVSGELELMLNYNQNIKSPVVAKCFNSQIIWIPKIPICFNRNYNYSLFAISLDEFSTIWRSLRYEPENDLKLISSVTYSEFNLAWLIFSNCRESQKNLNELVKYIKSKVLSLSTENKYLVHFFEELIADSWGSLPLDDKIILAKEEWESINAYLDNDSYLWNVFKIDEGGSIYIHLGNDLCIKVKERI